MKDVYKEMKKAENLMNDFAWNGEQKAYDRQKLKYDYYKELHDQGITQEPDF